MVLANPTGILAAGALRRLPFHILSLKALPARIVASALAGIGSRMMTKARSIQMLDRALRLYDRPFPENNADESNKNS
jgi:hypothetical protein